MNQEITRGAADLVKLIDHTLLKAEATTSEIETLCNEAHELGFFSVCVNPCFVPLAKSFLSRSMVKVCTVIGFPLGANTLAVKQFEAETACAQGADELDLVIHIGAVKDGRWSVIEDELHMLRQVAQSRIVKVIMETCLLSEAEKIQVCQLAADSGMDFVKTSTGFSRSGATIEDVALLRKCVGNKLGVKASGGIRDLSAALAMIEAGASRLGTSAGGQIIGGLNKDLRQDFNPKRAGY